MLNRFRFQIGVIILTLLIMSYPTLNRAEKEIMIPESFLDFYFTEQNERVVFLAEESTQKAFLISFRKEPLEFEIIKEFEISTGKQKGSKRSEWDLRTPQGIYQITQFRPQQTLQEKFGTGAFILDYPNALDRVLLKTGSGIWIHGTDREDFIDFDSEGCIRMKNEDLLFLTEYLRPKETTVVVTEITTLISEEEILRRKNALLERFRGWYSARQNEELKKTLSYYHPSFYSPKHNRDIARWTLWLKENHFKECSTKPSPYYNYDILCYLNYALLEKKNNNEENKSSETRIILWEFIDDNWFIVLEE